MWTMAAMIRVDILVSQVQEAILLQAEAHREAIMPAYTHLQRAQPVSVAHWLLSHFWALARDRQRLGAARQAAWTLTGEVAVWDLGEVATSDAPATPGLRERYAAARTHHLERLV
jgi:adenylosuccinate lyase